METPEASDLKAYPTCKICDRGTLMPRKIRRLSGPAVAIGYILLIPSILGLAACAILLIAIVIAGPALIRDGGILAVILGIGCFVGGLLGWLLVMKKYVLQCDICGAVVNAVAPISSQPERSTASARNVILGALFILGITGAIWAFIVAEAGTQTSTSTATTAEQVQPTPDNSTAEPVQPEYQGETASDNVDAEVSGALDNWAKAYESNDPTLIANCYADQVDRYFLRQNVTNTFVHDYMEAWFKDHDSRVTMFRIKDVAFQNETATTVQLRLVKEVVTTNSKGAAERLTPSQVSLKKVAGEWKITSERDFK